MTSPRGLVVVPSRRAAIQEIDRRIPGRVAWGGGIATLPELLDRALARHPSPRPRLRGVERALMLDALVDALEPEVRELFGPGITGPGAPRAIGAAIAELRMAALSAEESIGPARESRRLRALACALDAWERRLVERDRWDDADGYREAAAVIRDGGWPGRLDSLEVRGLYKVTRVEADFLLALARSARTVRVHVPFESHEEEATAYAFPYLHLWEGVVDPGLDIEIVYPHEPGGGAAAISIEPAVDPVDEARRIAAWVRRRAEAGAPLEEIGVVAAGPSGVAPRLVRELRRRGIPFHARRGESLADTPLFEALTAPFRLIEEGFLRADLEAWVASPLTAGFDPRSLLPPLSRGPAGGATVPRWHDVLKRETDGGADAILAALRTAGSLRSRERSPADFWEAYETILDRVGLSPDGAGGEAWSRWQEVLEELRDALVELDRWEHPPVGWRTHRNHLRRAIGERRARLGRPGRGVALLTPYDARGLRFRHGAVAGLVQGALTVPNPAAAVLGDRERERLNEHLGERRFRTSVEEGKEGSLLLAERVRSVEERLLLSWPEEGPDGAPRLPALELERLRRRRSLPDAEPAAPSPAPAWRAGVSADRIAALQRVERERAGFLARPVEERRGEGGRHDGAFPGAVATMLSDDVAGGALARWSASALESWRQCPHQFFQRYLLKVRPPLERPIEAESRVVGTLAHRALERIHGRGRSEAHPDPESISTAVEAAAGEIDPAERGDPAVWSATVRRVSGVLARYFEYLERRPGPEGFRPVAFELEFGPEPGAPSVPIETGRGAVDLVGRLDRLDRDGTGRLHVVDYKYSRARRSHREAVDEERCGVDRFQLYAYFLGARAWSRAKGLSAPPTISGAIHCLREPRVLGSILSPGADAIRDRIAATIVEALGGRYDPSPRDPDECAWCDYRRSCRIASAPVAEAVPGIEPEEEP